MLKFQVAELLRGFQNDRQTFCQLLLQSKIWILTSLIIDRLEEVFLPRIIRTGFGMGATWGDKGILNSYLPHEYGKFENGVQMWKCDETCMRAFTTTTRASMHQSLLVVTYYLINLSFKFCKDPRFRWGDILLFVAVYDLELEILSFSKTQKNAILSGKQAGAELCQAKHSLS